MLIVLVNPNLIDFKQNLDCLKVYLDTMMSIMRNEYQFGKQGKKIYIYISFPGKKHFEKIWQIKTPCFLEDHVQVGYGYNLKPSELFSVNVKISVHRVKKS